MSRARAALDRAEAEIRNFASRGEKLDARDLVETMRLMCEAMRDMDRRVDDAEHTANAARSSVRRGF